MAQKRTRAQKENPHHRFTLSWNPEDSVNRQINIGSKTKTSASKSVKSADILAKDTSDVNTKHAILKSLITVSFILCLELVIYLAWQRK